MSQSGQYIKGALPGPFIETIQGNSPSTPVGPNGSSGVINLIGLGAVNVTNVGAPANTVYVTVSGGGLAWKPATVSPTVMDSNTGYITTLAGTTIFDLPVSPSVGDVVRIAGYAGAGWTISISAGQGITYLSHSYATSLSSTVLTDSVELLCVATGVTDVWLSISANGTLSGT